MTYISTIEAAFEDDFIIVLKKPRCIHSVSIKDKPDEFTVETYLRAEVGIELPEGGLLQRLDYFTDGLILAAKSEAAFEFLKEEQKLNRFTKAYRVIAEGLFPKELEVLKHKIALIKDAKTVKVFDPLEQVKLGRKARPIPARLSVSDVVHHSGYSEVELYGEKLTRHQVRAQMAAAGHPLIGDKLYGSTTELLNHGFGDLEGFLLTANRLCFRHPKSFDRQDLTLK